MNVVSPIQYTGYGVVGKNVVVQLIKLGHHVSLFPIGQNLAVESAAEKDLMQQAIKNSELFDYNAPCLRIWHQHSLAERVGRGTYGALPIFELNKFTKREVHHLKIPDIILVPSTWAQVIIENETERSDVFVAPFGVDSSIFQPTPFLDGPYTFFNGGKWEVRKGHDILAEAFNKAFTQQDDVRMIMLPHNPFFTNDENKSWAMLYKSSTLGDKIDLVAPVKNHTQVANIMSHCHCGVFPSRAEGWNLELLEIMTMGRPVIATNYSAHTEFCNEHNAFLIEPTELEDAYDGKWFFGQGQWAKIGEEQMDQLVEHMRYCYKERPRNDAGIATGVSFSWEKTARKIISVLTK